MNRAIIQVELVLLRLFRMARRYAGRNIELSPTLSTPPKAFFQLQCGLCGDRCGALQDKMVSVNLRALETMCLHDPKSGEVPEWSNGAVSKTVVRLRTQGSNPCLSATFLA